MVVTENSVCPQCALKGKLKHIVSVFFKSEEALYTCEDKLCSYFLTDSTGNLVKFNKETKTTSYMLEMPVKDDSENDLNELLNSLTNNYNKEVNSDISYSMPNSDTTPADSNANQNNVFDNQPIQRVPQVIDSNISNSYNLFNTEFNSVNFDDLL